MAGAKKGGGGSSAASLPLLTETVTVAENRTIVVGGKRLNPGETVDLDIDEAKRLRGLGFLISVGAKAVPTASGPTFDLPAKEAADQAAADAAAKVAADAAAKEAADQAAADAAAKVAADQAAAAAAADAAAEEGSGS